MESALAAAAAEALSANLSVFDHSVVPLPASDPLLGKCRAAVGRRLQRVNRLPPNNIDPLRPLPLADSAEGGPAVHFVYFIMASRHYAHETINRNVRALQRPGALLPREGPPTQ